MSGEGSGAGGGKREVRARALELVRAMDAGARARESGAICAALLELLGAHWTDGAVMLYLASEGEPDLDGVARGLRERGRVVCAPRVGWEDRSMSPRALTGAAGEIEIRRHGVGEPSASCAEVALDAIGVVLTPGVAFDRRMARLGRGSGFYDRFLAEWRRSRAGAHVACGVGFTCQLVHLVPTEAHDALLDAVVTPVGVIGAV